MIRDDYTAWDECPDVDNCELIQSFLELVDSMVKDIQHLKAETVKARYELSQKLDPEHQWTTGADILSDLCSALQTSPSLLLGMKLTKDELTEKEWKVIRAYRSHTDVQKSVDKLLEIED